MIKVILCDDHAVVRRGIRDTIAEAVDIQVVGEAGSYPELRELMRKSPCDVLVLDINLPDLNGLDLQKAIAGDQHTMPIIFITGYGEPAESMKLAVSPDGN